MNFTARERYGLRAVLYLAEREGRGPVQTREMAQEEGIPEQFLEQVLAGLRRAGIARSIRGASGGYELARSARELTAGDVFRALSGPIVPIPCAESEIERCDRVDRCVVVDLWRRVQSAVSEILDGTTIEQLVTEKARMETTASYMMNI